VLLFSAILRPGSDGNLFLLQVFVMTAQILLNILRHSIVRMEAIHLLVLDECHHAVKKHPYSLVMSEFYHIAPKDSRPCVFGMTASPVNLKGI
jgi:endoribonuclease Dicer